jgi:hypothetical protein
MNKVQPHAVSATTVVKKPRVVKLPALSRKALDELGSKVEKSRLSLAARSPKFLHPWTVIAGWMKDETKVNDKLQLDSVKLNGGSDDAEHSWHLQIMPGFVNGTPVRIHTKVKNISENSKKRITKELKDSGLEDPNLDKERVVDVPLTEFPFFTATAENTRMIGYGSVPAAKASGRGSVTFEYEAVPEAFKRMGVVETEEKLTIGGAAGVKFVQNTLPPKIDEIRLLRALDVVLKIERPSLKFEITKGDPFMDGYSELVTPKYNRLAKSRRYTTLFLTSGPFTPPPELDFDDLLNSTNPSDPEFDYLQIATVYFISPFGTDPSEEMNKYWQVEVKYDVFWNLCHMPAEIPPIMNPEPLRVFLPPSVGFGIASSLINGILAPINDAVSRWMAMLRQKRLHGTFWST